MSLPRIRILAPADVPAATEALAHDLGDRRSWLEFAASHPACTTLLADAGAAVVGTAVGTANGPAGWLATIWVAAPYRGQGLGRALTQAVMDRLGDAGCRTFVLVSTDVGRPLYERMGYEVQNWYRILEAPGTADPIEASVRPFQPADLAAIEHLDAESTGEDRRHVLGLFASPQSALAATDPTGLVTGFVIRAPWGGGATIGADATTAELLVRARRAAAGPDRRVRVGLLSDNVGGLERLGRAGFRAIWSAPRMVAGAPLAWHPDRIYGQFNHAIG